ncbi:hypothetical protein ACFL6F_02325 [Planctomycetota bacterium]
MAPKLIAIIIAVLTLLCLVAYGFYYVGALADKKVTEMIIADIDAKKTAPDLKYDEEEFVLYLEILEDCQDGKIKFETLNVPMPVPRMILYELGFKNTILSKQDLDKIKDGSISILEKMSGETYRDDPSKWREWQEKQNK